MATPLHCSQNHSPLGDGESPTHWKWNHSMRQSLCSQTIMSPHSGPPQIHHNSALSRGASPDFLNAFPFLFAVAFWAPAWQCFLASHRCLTHISTSLEQRFVRFPLLIALFQSSSYFSKIMHASLSRLKHSFCNINILFLSVSLLTAAPRGDGTQSGNQSNEPPLGYSLLFKRDSMPLLSPTLPRDPKGRGFN